MYTFCLKYSRPSSVLERLQFLFADNSSDKVSQVFFHFQQLTASIVYNKPEKPLEFMMSEVEKMKKLKEEEDGKK